MPRIFENISPSTMVWARENAGYPDVESAAQKLHQPEERIREWEEGKKRPSEAQLKKVAKVYHRPVNFFYLKEVPEQFKIQKPVDFRRLSLDEHKCWTPNLILMIREALERQDWARELLGDEAESQHWAASANERSDPKALAGKIRDWLGISKQAQEGFHGDGRRFLNTLISLAESRGVFVSRYRPDKNRYRSIEPEIFRGIALKDPVAPLVVINPKDAIKGQIFTLLHELAHLWMDAPGLSNREPDKREDTRNRKIEAACNRVAAQVLMPESWFLAEWKECSGFSEAERIEKVAGVFSVSRESVARRLFDENEITWSQYMELRKEYQRDWQAEKARKKEQASQKQSSGGMASGMRVRLENGKKLALLALESYRAQEISAIEVSRALNMRVAYLGKLAEAVGIELHGWRSV